MFSHQRSIATLHLFPPPLAPIIFQFNSNTLCFHSAQLAVSIWANTSHCIPPLSFPMRLHFLSLHFRTVPSVFAKHREAEDHHSVNLLFLHESAATLQCPRKCQRKHKLVEPHFFLESARILHRKGETMACAPALNKNSLSVTSSCTVTLQPVMLTLHCSRLLVFTFNKWSSTSPKTDLTLRKMSILYRT